MVFFFFFFTPEAKQLRTVIPSHGEDVDISRWSGDKSAAQRSMKSLNTSLRDPLPWLMSQLTAKDKTHPSPQSGPFLSNNVRNGVLWCRYCVNNLNGDLGYWTVRSQRQTYTAPSDELARCCDFYLQNCCIWPREAAEAVILVLLNSMFQWHLFSFFFFLRETATVAH